MTNAPLQSKNTDPMITASVVSIAGAAATIIIYIVQQITGHPLPEQVDDAVLVLLEALAAFGAHRLTQ